VGVFVIFSHFSLNIGKGMPYRASVASVLTLEPMHASCMDQYWIICRYEIKGQLVGPVAPTSKQNMKYFKENVRDSSRNVLLVFSQS
jgi:hypothetical protein